MAKIIDVTRFGVLPAQFQQKVLFKFITFKNGIEQLGKATRDQMRTYIDDKTTRRGNTGNLKKSIEYYVEDSPTDKVVGVGSIAELNVRAPYWYVINYGGFTTFSARGESLYGYYGNFQRPDAAFRGTGVGTERFTQVAAGQANSFRMTPTAPIAPKNYIERTANWASTVWKIQFYNWSSSTKISFN